jgi:TolB-like protein
MRARILTPILVGLAGLARAEPPRPTLAVVDLEAKGATELEADAASMGVVRGLRQLDAFQVLSAGDVRQLLAIERSRQILGDAGDAGQVAGLGQALGAQHVVAGTVTKLGGELRVEIRLLDTAAGKVLAQKDLGPMGVEALAAALPPLAQELVGPLLREQQGELRVNSSEEAAEVVVDEVLVASTPMRTPVALPRGAHRLVVRKDGFIAQARTLRIEQGQLTVENVRLMPSADYAEAYRLRHGRLRVGAYIATALAVGAVGGAYLLDRDVTEPTYRHQFLPRKLALAESPPPEEFDAEDRRIWSQCGADPIACGKQLEGYQGAIRTQQFLTGGLIVVGAAAGVVATYLWLTGEDPNRYADLVAGVSLGPSPGLALGGRF